MSVSASVTANTATSVTLALAGMAADGTVDAQISPRADFQFCVCPIYSIARATPVTLVGLNQDCTYYGRVRDRRADGSVSAWSATFGFRTNHTADRDLTPAAVMIMPALIAPAEPVLSWAAGSAIQAGYPLENMEVDAPSAAQIAAPAGVASFAFQLGGAPIDTVGLLNTNFPEGCTVTLTAGQTSAQALGGSPLYTITAPGRASATLPGRLGYHSIVRLPAPLSYTWWAIKVSGVAFTADTCSIEHTVAGLNLASKNYSNDRPETPSQLGSFSRRRSGVPDRQLGLPSRHVEFDLSNLRETQYETIYSQLLSRQDRPALIIPNTKSGPYLHDRILYGALQAGKAVNTSSPFFTKSFAVDSILYT